MARVFVFCLYVFCTVYSGHGRDWTQYPGLQPAARCVA